MPFTAQQYVLYVVGCIVFSLGADCFIGSNLGTDPLDVFALGLKKHTHITVGLAQGGFALLCLMIWGLWNRKYPPLSPFVTFFFCGSLIDLWMWCGVATRVGMGPVFLLLAGVLFCAVGSSLIIMSGIGIRAMDLVAITMYQKLDLPFWLCKGVLEILLLVSGWTMGGPVGVGTLVFLGVVGWSIQPLMWFAEGSFGFPNYGLRPLESLETALNIK